MNRKYGKTCKLIISLLIAFVVVLSGCSFGGISSSSSKNNTTPTVQNKYTMDILSVDSTTVAKNGTVTLTIGLNTTESINTCGYQCILTYDTSRFEFTSAGSAADGLTVTANVDNNNMLRVVAIPQFKDGMTTVSEQKPELLELTFTANNTTGTGTFQLKNHSGFSNSVSIYNDNGKATNVTSLGIGKSQSVIVQ